MAKLSITEAATLTQVNRSTLHRAIKQGRLSRDPDGQLDTAELLRAGFTLQTAPEAPRATVQHDALQHHRATEQRHATLPRPSVQQTTIAASEREMAALQRECNLLLQQLDTTRAMLQQQLDATRTMLQREQEQAAERERDYWEQIRYLTQMLHEERQRYDRLLEAPRPAPPPQAARSALPRGDPHAMRRRVLEVLAAHPEGLHHTALAQALGYGGDLSPTLRAMHRDRLVQRVGPGVYQVAKDTR
jgi:hypothetical protein